MKNFLTSFSKLNYTKAKSFGQNLEQNFKKQVTNITSKSGRSTKNALAASLIGLASITAGGVLYATNNDRCETQNCTYVDDTNTDTNELENELKYINPQLLAKGNGVDTTLIEPSELEILLDYGPLEGLPIRTVNQVRETIYSNLKNIEANDSDSKLEINNQIKNAQSFINGVAIDSYFSIRQFYTNDELEYLFNFVSGSEILNRINFTELRQYQEDLSMTKLLIRNSLSNIKRNDPICEEKVKKQVESSQKFIDRLVDNYKLQEKLIGNLDCNEQLTQKEFINLLDLSMLTGLEKNLAYTIIADAIGDYKPYTLRDNCNEDDVQELNKEIMAKLSEVQQYINNKAMELNPNIIKFDPEQKTTTIIGFEDIKQ